MLYKPDWDMTKKRFEAFWNREVLDRCMVAVTARKDNPVTSEYPPLPSADLVARWTASASSPSAAAVTPQRTTSAG